MGRLVVFLVTTAAAFGATAGESPAAAPAATKVCTQLTGAALPHASYLSVVSGVKSTGNTWTVLATGVPCSDAVRQAPGLLARWAKAKLGATIPWPGYTCLKMVDRTYDGAGASSGGLVCHKGAGAPASVFGPATFAVRETAPYSIPQVKAFFGIR